MRQYRLIYDDPASGVHNMAVDEAIMQAVAAGNSPPTLRLYAWEPACLSLGYAQPWHDVDPHRLARCGVTAVRRPTGGRAIFHADELTYSIALPLDHPLAKGQIVESYRRISQALMVALEHLGASTRAERQERSARKVGPVCFETPSHYEITTEDGRKLVGSAQTRRRGGILQHGSLPLHGDVARICDVLAYPEESQRLDAKHAVRQRAATLADALGVIVNWQRAADALVLGFIQAHEMSFFESGLTAEEQAQAEQIGRNTYGMETHLHRV